MIREADNIPPERAAQTEAIRLAVADAVREALNRHARLGESVVVMDEYGRPRTVTADELRNALDAS